MVGRRSAQAAIQGIVMTGSWQLHTGLPEQSLDHQAKSGCPALGRNLARFAMLIRTLPNPLSGTQAS